jgi:hypothetical protein
MNKIFELDGMKDSTAEFAVEIDLSSWLGAETIDSVAYSARCLNDGTDVTDTVLDIGKHVNTTTTVKPWIRGGVSGNTYLIKMITTGSVGSVEVFGIQFSVYDH